MEWNYKSLNIVVIFLITILFGCGKNGPTSGPLSVSYKSGELILPDDAKVLFNGKELSGTQKVPQDQLCVITIDNKNYLYFTGMPPAQLSDSTSRLAVGYFITKLSMEEQKKASSGATPNNLADVFSFAGYYSNSSNFLQNTKPFKEEVSGDSPSMLKTGIK